MTFDAGSIDSRLTLDRSAFNRELQEARLQAQRFEQQGISIPVRLESIMDELNILQEEINHIDGRDIDVNIQVHNLGELEALKARIDSLTGKTIQVDVDASLIDLQLFEERIEALRDRSIRLDVDVFSPGLQSVQQRINAIEGRNVFVGVSTETSALLDLQADLRALNDETIDLRVQILNSIAEFTRIRNQIDELSQHEITINTRFTNSRAEFTRLRNTIDALDGESFTINAVVNGYDQLVALQTLIEALDPSTIHIDVDTTDAIAELAALEAIILGMSSTATVNVDVDSGAALAELAGLEAVIQSLDGNDIDIDVNMRDRGGSIGRTTGTVTRMEAIIAAILLLAPLVPAVIAPGAAAVGALAAGLTAAAGGAAVLGLGLFGTIKPFTEAKIEIGKLREELAGLTPGTKEYREVAEELAAKQEDFNETFGAASAAYDAMGKAWGRFQDETRPASLGLITQFFGIVEDILPNLTPIFDAFAEVAGDALQSISDFINGPEGERMFTFFEEIGAQSFDEILQNIGNLALFFGRLFEAFGPFAIEMLDGLSEITAGWAEWADGLGETEGFIDFIDYARTVGPQVLDMLGSLFDAFLAIGKALAPLSGPALAFFTGLFDAIAGMPTGLLTTLIVLFGGLFLAVQAFTAIGQIYRATIAAMGVATSIFGGIMTVVQGIMTVFGVAWRLLNLAFTASPIGVIIVAIIALIAVFVLAYQKIEWFRNGVDAIVKAVVGFFQWLYDQLWGGSILKDLIEAFTTAFEIIFKVVTAPARLMVAIVRTVFNALVGFFSGVFSRFSSVIKTGWNIIKGHWNAALDVIKTAIRIVFQTIPAMVREKIDAVMDIIRGLKDRVTGFFSSARNWLINAGKNIIQGLIDGVTGMLGKLRDKLDFVGKLIPDWKGPPSKDRRLLRPAGALIMQGLIDGFDDGLPGLEGSLSRITNKIEATSAGISAELGARGRIGAGQTRQGGDMNVTIISPSRLRVDEAFDVGLDRVAVRHGWR